MTGVGPGGVQELSITSGRAQLGVSRWDGRVGGAGPSVVFLHAGVADRRSWIAVAEELSSRDGIDAVAYDRRTFGTTTYEPETHDQVEDLWAVLGALDVAPVVLVGNSRGGEVALSATLASPGRVRALVLVAPAIAGAPEVGEADVTPVEAALWETLEAADNAGDLEALNEGEVRLWLDGPEAPAGRVGGAARELALDMNRIALHAEDPGYEREPPDDWSRLDAVAVPTLVVAAELDMAHMTQRCHVVAERIPGAVLHVMPGVAHLPGLEAPAEFAAVLREFLAGL